jgi:hypothetical protein
VLTTARFSWLTGARGRAGLPHLPCGTLPGQRETADAFKKAQAAICPRKNREKVKQEAEADGEPEHKKRKVPMEFKKAPQSPEPHARMPTCPQVEGAEGAGSWAPIAYYLYFDQEPQITPF